MSTWEWLALGFMVAIYAKVYVSLDRIEAAAKRAAYAAELSAHHLNKMANPGLFDDD